ncbi:uncharacterized protein LOC120344336 [Styela clava]
MTSTDAERKADHAVNVMLSMEQMKNREFLCDFIINVDKYSFKTHRVVLAACSSYFNAMFSSNMKEVREGSVTMMDIESDAMRKCIEYMYVGEVDISMEEVEDVLHVSKLIQLDGLSEECFKYLQEHLSADNCLSSMSLSQMYGREDVSIVIEEYIRQNLEFVITTELFPYINTTSLMRYAETTTSGYWVSWNAISTWLHHNGNKVKERADMENVMKFMNPDVFPFEFLLSTVLNDLFVQNCEHGVELLLHNLFFNTQALKENISISNCFLLQSLSSSPRLNSLTSLLADEVITDFMATNIHEISKKHDFLLMPKRTVQNMFNNLHSKNAPQEVIWDALTKWVKFTDERNSYFSDLFCSVKLLNFTYSFLKQTALANNFVRQSRDCLQHILRAICERSISGEPMSHIALLQQDTTEIKTFELSCRTWETMNSLPEGDFKRIISVDRKLFILNDGHFSCYKKDHWIQSTSLKRRRPSPWAQITTFGSFIYVVEGKCMSYYDTVLDCWVEDLPGCSIVMGFCVSANQRYIYAIGGKSAKRYESKEHKWKSIAPLHIERYDASAAALQERIYVMGGNVFGKILNSAECYSPINDTWEVIRNMLLPRSHFSAFAITDKLYAVGGNRNVNNDGDQSDSIEIFDASSQKWKMLTKIPETKSRVLACHYSPDEVEVIEEITRIIGLIS